MRGTLDLLILKTVGHKPIHVFGVLQAWTSSPWSSQLGLNFFVSQIATEALVLFGSFGLLLSIAALSGSRPTR